MFRKVRCKARTFSAPSAASSPSTSPRACAVTDDDHGRAHAGEEPAIEPFRERHVFADDAVGHIDNRFPPRKGGDVEDGQLASAERGDIGLGALRVVEDVVRANLLAVESPQAPGKVYNICSGREITILNLLDYLREVLPGAPEHRFEPPRPGDIYRSVGDPSLAANDLNFEARTELTDGLMRTVEWMRS